MVNTKHINIPRDFPYGPYNKLFGEQGHLERLGAGFMDKVARRDNHMGYSSDHYSLCYILEGEGWLEDNNGRHELKAGQFFQRFPGIEHSSGVVSPTWTECFIVFGISWSRSLEITGVLNRQLSVGTVGLRQTWIDRFADQARSMDAKRPFRVTDFSVKSLALVQELYQATRVDKASTSQKLDLACTKLTTNLDQSLDIMKLCKEIHWGYESFRKTFKAELGVSPRQFRVRARMDEAQRLLLTQRDLNINDISSRLGYRQVYEFSARFKAFFGCSPTDYRKAQGLSKP
jgi:AraC-like DNA-binding protein